MCEDKQGNLFNTHVGVTSTRSSCCFATPVLYVVHVGCLSVVRVYSTHAHCVEYPPPDSTGMRHYGVVLLTPFDALARFVSFSCTFLVPFVYV